MSKQLSEIICHDNFNIICRINDVMRDIICLKKENRSLSQRINNLHQKRSEYIKVIKKTKVTKIYCESMIKRLTLTLILRYY